MANNSTFLDEESRKIAQGGPAIPYVVQGAKNIASPQAWREGSAAIGDIVRDVIKSPPGGGYTPPGRTAAKPSAIPNATGAASDATDYQPDMSLTPPVHGNTDIYAGVPTKDYGNSVPLNAGPFPAPKSVPVAPKSAVMNWNPNGGDPTIPYRVGERNMPSAVPGAGPSIAQRMTDQQAAERGVLSAVPLGMQYTPGREAPGVVAEANRRGIGIENTGAVPGGNVSQFVMSEDAQKEAQARRDSAVPAMASYTRALDEANVNEGIHGAAMAREAQKYKDKYGIDLRRNEFALKQKELAQNAPKVDAEAAYYNANAKKLSAEATAVPGKNDHIAQGWRDSIKIAQAAILKPKDITEDDTAYQNRIAEARQMMTKAHDELSNHESKSISRAGKLSPDQVASIKQRISEAKKKGYTDTQINADLTSKGINPADLGA